MTSLFGTSMMNKTTLLAAAILSLGASALTPAFAAEGNGNPFDTVQYGQTRLTRPAYAQADVGQSQYPDVVGRPGSNLSTLANNQILPTEGSEQPVQTANSLPRGFEQGTVTYAQAQSINNWMVAHNSGSMTTAAR
jgi:hypothetical protein